MEMDFPVPGWGDLVRENIGSVLKWVVIAALLALLILFVLRPLVGRIGQAGSGGLLAGTPASVKAISDDQSRMSEGSDASMPDADTSEVAPTGDAAPPIDRKSTRLNSSH